MQLPITYTKTLATLVVVERWHNPTAGRYYGSSIVMFLLMLLTANFVIQNISDFFTRSLDQ